MNARKRANRRAERRRPTLILQEDYRPHYTDPVAYRLRALDGNGRESLVEITRGQARKFGFSEGLIQPEAARAWKRVACYWKEQAAGAAGESNPKGE